MAAPRKDAARVFSPYHLLDADTDEEDANVAANADVSMLAGDQSSVAEFFQKQGIESVPRPLVAISQESSPVHAISHRMALRVMRDAIALQLARRGFDGLRQSALWLVAELTTDFLRALGTQLRREGATPSRTPTTMVRRMQRQTNMPGLADWQNAQAAFALVAEPAAMGVPSHREPNRHHAPSSVAPLYAAMRGAWNYKQTAAGRQAHVVAGQLEIASAASAPLNPAVTGRELSESLRLSKKQRQQAESWLQSAPVGGSNGPVLLPGHPDVSSAGAAAKGGARSRKK